MVAPPTSVDPQVDRELREERSRPRWRDVELEAVVAGRQRSLEEVAHPAVAVGQGLGHPDRAVCRRRAGRASRGRRRPAAHARCRGRGSRSSDRVFRAGGHAILRAMGTLRIGVGDLHFSARWEPAAPRTIEAIRRMLPIESKLIHCRWTGESTWIPFGDFRPGSRLREPHLAPGAREAGDLPGRHQRVRDLLPVRRLHDRVEGRPAGGQPFRAIDPDEGWETGSARWAAAACGRAPRTSGSARSRLAHGRRADPDRVLVLDRRGRRDHRARL